MRTQLMIFAILLNVLGIFNNAICSDVTTWSYQFGASTPNLTAMTQDKHNNLIASNENGIYKSYNDGKTWKKIEIESNPGFRYLQLLADSSILAVSNNGVYRSIDDGESWELKTTQFNNIYGFDYSKDNKIYIVMAIDDNKKGLYCSDDYGKNWKILNDSFNVNPNYLTLFFPMKIDLNNNIFVYDYTKGVEKTTDNGKTWFTLNEYTSSHYDTYYSFYLLDNNDLLAACYNEWGNNGSGLFLIKNGTTVLIDTLKELDEQWIFHINTDEKKNFYLSTFDGLYKLDSTFSNLKKLYEDSVVIYSYSIDTNKICIGLSDLSSWNSVQKILFSTNSGSNWQDISFNSYSGKKITAFCEYPENDFCFGTEDGIYKTYGNKNFCQKVTNEYAYKKIINIIPKENELFAFIDSVGVMVSQDSGWTWKLIDTSFKNIKINSADLFRGYLFVAATANGLFYSEDEPNNWSREEYFGSKSASYITKSSNQNYYLAFGNEIYVSKDELQTWQNLTFDFPQDIGISSIAANSVGDIFVGTNGKGMYRLLAGDMLWKQININLRSFYVNGIIINNENEILIGTDKNLYYSNLNGDFWNNESINLQTTLLKREKNGKIYACFENSIIYLLDSINNKKTNNPKWIKAEKYYYQNYPTSGVKRLFYSNDGKYFYTFHNDFYLRKWVTSSGELIYEKYYSFKGTNYTTTTVDFTKDLKYALVGYEDRIIKYDLINDTIMKEIQTYEWFYPGQYFFPEWLGTSAYFTPDSKQFIFAFGIWYSEGRRPHEQIYTGKISLYNSETCSIVKDIDTNLLIYNSVYSKDGLHFAYSGYTFNASSNGTNYYQNYDKRAYCDGSVIKEGTRNGENEGISFCPFTNKSTILSGYRYKTNSYLFWDVKDNSLIKEKSIEEKKFTNITSTSPRCCCFSTDDKYLLYITFQTKYENSINSSYNVLNFMHYESGEVIDSIILPTVAETWGIVNSPVSNEFIVCNSNGELYLFNPTLFEKDLIAIFKADTVNVITGDTIHFTDYSEGKIKTRKWSFGDGKFSTEKNPTHIYKYSGIYTVALIVSDGKKSDTLQRNNYIYIKSPLKADFELSSYEGEYPLTIQAINNSKGDIISYFWDFGDGTTSSEKEPKHIYVAKGHYTLILIVFDGIWYDTLQKTVKIINPKITNFNIGMEDDYFEDIYDWFGYKGIECFDGSFAISAYTYRMYYQDGDDKDYRNFNNIIKLDEKGNYLWKKEYWSLFGIEQTSDSCLITFGYCYRTVGAGYETDFQVIKLNKFGDTVGYFVYDSSPEDYCCSVTATQDGGFILIGQKNYNMQIAIVIKCDKYGVEEWRKDYKGTGGSIYNISNDGYLLRIYNNVTIDYNLTRIDKDGNTIWEQTYDNDTNFIGNNLIETNDNYIVVGSLLLNNLSFGKVVKVDKNNGKVIWSYQSPDSNTKYLDIAKISDNEFAVVGNLPDSIGLIMFDKSKDSVKKFIFGYRKGYINSIVRTKDNGLFLVGTFYPPNSKSRLYALKLNNVLPTEVNETIVNKSENYIKLFPNPTDNNVTISYNLASDGKVRLSLFNQFGEEIAIIKNIDENAGQHFINYSFDNSALSNGIYFIQLKAGNSVITEKIVLVR